MADKPTDDLQAKFDALLAPFPPDAVAYRPVQACKACKDLKFKACPNHRWVKPCPECHGSHSTGAVHLDYVGHADVTRRLLEVDPTWTWEPMAYTDQGLPLATADGLWIKLTVLGVTRLGFGDAGDKRGGDAIKEIIGDAIRNAAMRFGVAVDLWSKSDAALSRKQADQGDGETAPAPAAAPEPPRQAKPNPRVKTAFDAAKKAKDPDDLRDVWTDVTGDGIADEWLGEYGYEGSLRDFIGQQGRALSGTTA